MPAYASVQWTDSDNNFYNQPAEKREVAAVASLCTERKRNTGVAVVLSLLLQQNQLSRLRQIVYQMHDFLEEIHDTIQYKRWIYADILDKEGYVYVAERVMEFAWDQHASTADVEDHVEIARITNVYCRKLLSASQKSKLGRRLRGGLCHRMNTLDDICSRL